MDPAVLATAALIGAVVYAGVVIAEPEFMMRGSKAGGREFKRFGTRFTADTSPLTPASLAAAAAAAFVVYKGCCTSADPGPTDAGLAAAGAVAPLAVGPLAAGADTTVDFNQDDLASMHPAVRDYVRKVARKDGSDAGSDFDSYSGGSDSGSEYSDDDSYDDDDSHSAAFDDRATALSRMGRTVDGADLRGGLLGGEAASLGSVRTGDFD